MARQQSQDSVLAQALGKVFSGVFGQAVGKFTQGLTSTLEKAFSSLTKQLAIAGTGGPIIGEKGGNVLRSIPLVGDALDVLRKSFLQAAGLFDPVSLRLFQRVTADITATLGRVFAPILDVVTKGLRLFGDFLATILPSTDEVRQALSPLSEALDDFRSVLADLAPVIKDLIRGALVVLGTALRGLAYAVTFVIEALREIGLLAPSQGKGLKSSVGAAPGPARFTDPTEYVRQIQARAFSLGKREEPPAVKTNNILNEVKQTIDGILGFMKELKINIYDPIKRAVEAVGEAVSGIWNKVSQLSGAG